MEIWIFFVYIFSNPQLKVHHKLFFLYKVPKFDFFSLRLPNERGGVRVIEMYCIHFLALVSALPLVI